VQEEAMRGIGSARRGPVYEITGARRGLSEDIRYRQRRYVISMSIRTVCFVLAILTTGTLRWTFFILALVLPYISVVFANGGREPTHQPPSTLLTQSPPEIDSSHKAPGQGDS
jgi:hypothetical protein